MTAPKVTSGPPVPEDELIDGGVAGSTYWRGSEGPGRLHPSCLGSEGLAKRVHLLRLGSFVMSSAKRCEVEVD